MPAEINRDERAFESLLRARVTEALTDKRADIAANDILARLFVRHQGRLARDL
ncbi:MAG TPA: hypothetical protein VGF77_15435 [Allosphingosinicella sp.]|jgi:hypothetical protein